MDSKNQNLRHENRSSIATPCLDFGSTFSPANSTITSNSLESRLDSDDIVQNRKFMPIVSECDSPSAKKKKNVTVNDKTVENACVGRSTGILISSIGDIATPPKPTKKRFDSHVKTSKSHSILSKHERVKTVIFYLIWEWV